MFRLMVINVLNNKRKLKMVTVSATISFCSFEFFTDYYFFKVSRASLRRDSALVMKSLVPLPSLT